MRKTISILGVLVAATLMSSSTLPPAPQSPAGPCICHKIVRVDYIDLSGNHPHSDTFCEVFNASHTTPISMTDVWVLGAGGTTDIRAWYTGLYGQTVPPLGRVRFPVNVSAMPTLVPQTSNGNHGVANVVVGWTGGSLDSVVLTSNTVRVANGSQDDRTEVHYVGYPVRP